jgi:hypothetical protein
MTDFNADICLITVTISNLLYMQNNNYFPRQIANRVLCFFEILRRNKIRLITEYELIFK